MRIIIYGFFITTPLIAALQSKCSICGAGKEVGNPDAIFRYPGQEPIQCSILQRAGSIGEIADEVCKVLSLVIGVCECEPTTAVSESNLQPNDPSSNECSICGDGKEVGDHDAIFNFPGLPNVTCSVLEMAGKNGLIEKEECTFIPDLVGNLCKCRPQESGFIDVKAESATPVSFSGPSIDSKDDSSEFINGAPPLMIDTHPQCSICGAGKEVGKLDAIFRFPGQLEVPCGILQVAGNIGTISPQQCLFLPTLIDMCECKPVIVISDPIQSIGNPSSDKCSVCGNGKEVGDYHAFFEFPGQPVVTCSALESAGKNGLIRKEECTYLPGLIGSLCKCQPYEAELLIKPTENPNVGPPEDISIAPVPFPTPAPSPSPSDRPSYKFTVLTPILEPISGIESSRPVVVAPESNTPSNDIFLERCSICGDGKRINDYDAIFDFPGQPLVTCGVLESAGKNGLIPKDACNFFPELIGSLCNCQPYDSESLIIPPKNPTPSPILELKPIIIPPVPFPTPAPSPNPSDVPSSGTPASNKFAPDPFPTPVSTSSPPVPFPTPAPSPNPSDVPSSGTPVSSIFTPDPFPTPVSTTSPPVPFPTPAPSPNPSDVPSSSTPVSSIFTPDPFPTPVFTTYPPVPFPTPAPSPNPSDVPSSSTPVSSMFTPDPFPTPVFTTYPPVPFPTPAPSPNPSDVPSNIPPVSNVSNTAPPVPFPTSAKDDAISYGSSTSSNNTPFPFHSRPVPTSSPELNDVSYSAAPITQVSSINEIPFFESSTSLTQSDTFSPSLVNDPIPECSICGEGKEVGNSDASFTFPGQPEVKCGILQSAGYVGIIQTEQCAFLPSLVEDICACKAILSQPRSNNASDIVSSSSSSIPAVPPTIVPSITQSLYPSNIPSVYASFSPSFMPSNKTSSRPFNIPALFPSISPTFVPSSMPSYIPNDNTSSSPTVDPSSIPSNAATLSLSPFRTKVTTKHPAILNRRKGQWNKRVRNKRPRTMTRVNNR